MSPVFKTLTNPNWERIPKKNSWYYRKNPIYMGRKNSIDYSNFKSDKDFKNPETAKEENIKWARKGKNNPTKDKSYTLSFVFTFEREDDEYFFAYSYPYSYTKLQKYLYFIEKRKFKYFKRKLLCRTIQHRRCDLLTITNPNSKKKKKSCVITARCHPGETPSSLVMHGIISFLLGTTEEAKKLRDNIIFHLIPMLNPDGTFLGNYRTNSAGDDLNRRWLNPNKVLHPTLHATRKLLIDLKEDKEVDLDFFLDLHAHSVLHGAFLYCNGSDNMKFPRLLAQKIPFFSFENTKKDLNYRKLGSGRRALGEVLGISKNCFTCEVSFYCYEINNKKMMPFDEKGYLLLGKNIVRVFKDFYGIE